ncbi:MAG: hypothetical protein ACRD22_04320 [Terriglobia bacterium]
MGYYHSWDGLDSHPEAFAAIRADFEKLILPLADLGCPIAGPLGTGVPEITDDCIHFNGIRDCGHEKMDGPVVVFPTKYACGIDSSATTRLIDTPIMTFATKRRCDGECCHEDLLLYKHYSGGWCKTAFKPYDVAVTAALLIAKHYCREGIEITSCGSDMQWWDARLICQRVLGYGNSFRFVSKRRLSNISGQSQWIEEEVFEEIPGNQVFDPVYLEGFKKGRREGLLRMARQQIEYRLGPIRPVDEETLSRLPCGEIEDVVFRLLEAKTLEELFP